MTRSSARPSACVSRRSSGSRAIFVGLGVRKLRLTGGEPLLRRDLPELVRQLARDFAGVETSR